MYAWVYQVVSLKGTTRPKCSTATFKRRCARM